jgi:hypothetical protein
MKRAASWLLVPQFMWCVVVFGCDDEIRARKMPTGDEPIVPSRPGIVQVGGSGDPLIDEAEACSRFSTALTSAITRLKCMDMEVSACPELVHPLVDLPCILYSEPSVERCEGVFGMVQTCGELKPGGCVLTAILDPTDTNGVPLECEERDVPTSDCVPAQVDAGTLSHESTRVAACVEGGAGSNTTGTETSEAAISLQDAASSGDADVQSTAGDADASMLDIADAG